MPSIGEILREARNKKGISEEVVAKALKAKVERIRDLEDNRYDQFAAQIYARSFLRHYAEYLGIESGPLLQRFIEENPPSEVKSIFEITEEQRIYASLPHRSLVPSAFFLTTTGKIVMIAILAILIVIAFATWWIIQTSPLSHHQAIAPNGSPPQTSFHERDSIEEPQEPSLGTAPTAPLAPLTLSTNVPPTESRRNP